MNPPIQPYEVFKKSRPRPSRTIAMPINEAKKGLCLYCGEIFNLKDYHRDALVCPECAELFDLPTPRLR
jgi:hypothetical protein